MKIEIIPKKREREGSSIREIALYLGIGLLILSLLVSAIFYVLTQRIKREVEEAKVIVEGMKSPEIIKLQEEIRDHHERVADFAHLLNTRVSPFPVFGVLEEVVHPEVYFSGLQINLAERKVSTTGVARDIIAYDQQVRILQNNPKIIDVSIGGFTRETGGQVTFPITLILSEELFKVTN